MTGRHGKVGCDKCKRLKHDCTCVLPDPIIRPVYYFVNSKIQLKEPKLQVREVNKPTPSQQHVLDMLDKLVSDEKRNIGKSGNLICCSKSGDLYERFIILFCKNKKEHWGWHNIKSDGFPSMGIRLITKNMILEYHFSEQKITYACGKLVHFFNGDDLICNCRQSKRKRIKQ